MLMFLLNICIYWILIFYLILYAVFKLTARRCTSKVCLTGKTVLITGGNRGIGLATSLDLASRGCRLIIACRSNPEEVKQKIIKATKNSNIIVKHLDLMSLESVRNFAKDINETETRLDILINNAGIGSSLNKYTQDNLNPVMQTNYFGPFLLTHLLVDLLKKTPKSRVVFVSSFLSYVHNLTIKNLNIPENQPISTMNSIRIYGNSKLCEIIAMRRFAEKLKPFGVNSVNAVQPGLVYTGIFESLSLCFAEKLVNFLYMALKVVMKTPEEGAQPTLTAAISNEFENITGKFIWDFQYTPTHGSVKDKAFCDKIWEMSESYVKLAPYEKL